MEAQHQISWAARCAYPTLKVQWFILCGHDTWVGLLDVSSPAQKGFSGSFQDGDCAITRLAISITFSLSMISPPLCQSFCCVLLHRVSSPAPQASKSAFTQQGIG